MLFYGARHFTYFKHCIAKEFKFAALIYDFLFLLLCFIYFSTFIFFINTHMERESELRASDTLLQNGLLPLKSFRCVIVVAKF